MREAHERPEANEEAVTIMTGTNLRNVINAIKYFENNPLTNNKKEIIASYSKENVSDTIVKIIISFINYIKQNNYKKNIN